ncbi:helix-turn-helix transcriptional regulator [Castellaniella hirudinis]|uniref:helix-turn-helix transcriptional regulator n=1 Tax=Castellaniella hirudinis TaxID=1144617 RepID=UPI0039C07713
MDTPPHTPANTRPLFASNTLVRVPDICRNPKTGQPGILPISRSTWYEWVKQGIAPPGMRIGGRTVVWRLSDIQAMAKAQSGR